MSDYAHFNWETLDDLCITLGHNIGVTVTPTIMDTDCIREGVKSSFASDEVTLALTSEQARVLLNTILEALLD